VQRPWSELILSGEKTVEARRYPLKGYKDEDLWLIATWGPSERRLEELKRCISGMRGNSTAAGTLELAAAVGNSSPSTVGSAAAGKRRKRDRAAVGPKPAAPIAGLVRFHECWRYESYEQWRADAGRHCIPQGSEFDWCPEAGPMYGWLVAEARPLQEPQPGPAQKGMIGCQAVTRMALFGVRAPAPAAALAAAMPPGALPGAGSRL